MQYSNLIWRNKQPYSERFDDIYYSTDQDECISGESEFNHVFFKHNNLAQRWSQHKQFVIAELGLGSGLNCLLTIKAWLKHCEACDEDKTLHYIAIEKYPLSPEAISELISRYSELQMLCDAFLKHYPPAVETTHVRRLFDHRVVIHFKFMDAYDALKDAQLKVNAWYLDGFSPTKNEAMWSQSLFQKLADNSAHNATLSTYTAAGFVKRHLQNAGFNVSKVKGHGKKREMLTGVYCVEEKKQLYYEDKPWFQPVENKYDTHSIGHQPEEKSLTIVGAGIAGLATAYAMIQRGWQVRLIDKHNAVAQETSSNPAAIIYPRLSVDNSVDMAFYTAAYNYTLYMLTALQSSYDESFWYGNGLLQKIEAKKLFAIIEKFEFNNNYISLLESPGSSTDIKKDKKVFSHFVDAGVVVPHVLCEAIKKQCGKKLTMLQADIDDIRYLNNTWQLSDHDGLVDEAEVLVLANGTGINHIGMDAVFSTESVRGQVALFNENRQSKKIDMAINDSVYVTPPIKGQHCVGASYSRDSLLQDVDDRDTKDLLGTVNTILPGVFSYNDYVTSWVGFRSMSKDRVPIVGAVPDVAFFNQAYMDICHGKLNKNYPAAQYLSGLYVSSAHGSRGFTSSFLSAEIIAAQINNEPMPVSRAVANYLSPSRFIINNLKRR